MKQTRITALFLTALAIGFGVASGADLDPNAAARFAGLALDCVHREYPNKIAHVLASDEDVQPPRQLTPVFYGCYDWHSAVHGHWLLARLARFFPGTELDRQAREALDRSFIPQSVQGEVAYLEAAGRVSFERPYGLAWLLQLAAEFREWDDPRAQWWAFTLGPLERVAVERLTEWLPKLTDSIRVGEHSQTAFAFGLILDWARIAGDQDMTALMVSRIRDFYLRDRNCPLSYEPSGQDFLSPCLAEADLVRRVLPPAEFAAWLGAFLPEIPFDGTTTWLEPAVVTDPEDPKLAHLDGLNLSRAWMLDGIASGLPKADPRLGSIRGAADQHRHDGLNSVTGEHYEGGHWLGSFATYLVTERGLSTLTEQQEDGKKK